MSESWNRIVSRQHRRRGCRRNVQARILTCLLAMGYRSGFSTAVGYDRPSGLDCVLPSSPGCVPLSSPGCALLVWDSCCSCGVEAGCDFFFPEEGFVAPHLWGSENQLSLSVADFFSYPNHAYDHGYGFGFRCYCLPSSASDLCLHCDFCCCLMTSLALSDLGRSSSQTKVIAPWSSWTSWYSVDFSSLPYSLHLMLLFGIQVQFFDLIKLKFGNLSTEMINTGTIVPGTRYPGYAEICE